MDSTNPDIMTAIKNTLAGSTEGATRTENGALGFSDTGSGSLVDFFYKVSSMRRMDPVDKQAMFSACLADDLDLAVRLLFFVRDVRGGMGERQTFRDVFQSLPSDLAVELIGLIPEYGRWDDVLSLYDRMGREVGGVIADRIRRCWERDLANAARGDGEVSLLAKWLPSPRKVAKDKVRLARCIYRDVLGITEERYRKCLSELRAHIRVVERDMTLGRWSEIDYEGVPSKAGLRYANAFMEHDPDRRQAYLDSLAEGKAKVNAATLFPYEIVSKYVSHGLRYLSASDEDPLLEAAWKALPAPTGILGRAIVVRDGSGSMTSKVSSGKASALDVSTAMAIFMAERLEGPFANRFITFSSEPKLVDLTGYGSLVSRLRRVYAEDDCSNTDIEATMDLVLRAAVKGGLRQEDIPAVVIISDMEFDAAHVHSPFHDAFNDESDDEALFETIRAKWRAKGYELPKMVFWNVCNRSGAVPMQENGNGLLLVSGFSQSILDMLNGTSPREALVGKLLSPRYEAVGKAVSRYLWQSAFDNQ